MEDERTEHKRSTSEMRESMESIASTSTATARSTLAYATTERSSARM